VITDCALFGANSQLIPHSETRGVSWEYPSKAAYDRSRDVLQSSSATELSVFSYVK
jgi:hypothetical protein